MVLVDFTLWVMSVVYTFIAYNYILLSRAIAGGVVILLVTLPRFVVSSQWYLHRKKGQAKRMGTVRLVTLLVYCLISFTVVCISVVDAYVTRDEVVEDRPDS